MQFRFVPYALVENLKMKISVQDSLVLEWNITSVDCQDAVNPKNAKVACST